MLHFVLLGGLLFALDHALITRESDPHTIVVDSTVVEAAKKEFRASHNRDPDAQELRALTRPWVDNEILFREGLALGVDRGDSTIRDRVIFKTLLVLETEVRLPAVDDAKLRVWFEQRRDKYDEPEQFDFQEAVLSGAADNAQRTEQGEAAVHALAAALNAGVSPGTRASLRVFKGRSYSNLVQSYGAEFARALQALSLGEWRVLPSPDGERVMQLQAVAQARPADFEAIRSRVLQDWTDATLADLRAAAVQERGKKYTLKYAESMK